MLCYVVVMTVSVIMYKGMGISNTDIALYTSWLYLPWVIKPLWSPVVDILKTRPTATEICVKKVHPLRFAAEQGRERYDQTFSGFNAAMAAPGNMLPDFPLINKSFELCYSCCDR